MVYDKASSSLLIQCINGNEIYLISLNTMPKNREKNLYVLSESIEDDLRVINA